MGKAEALLKVILSPVESVADTYRARLLEGTVAYFQRILDLKGLKKTEQQTLLEDFNKHDTGIIPQAPSMVVATSVSVPAAATPLSPTPSPSTTSAITNREDVLTRAVALRRGATTTGFRRFLALIERTTLFPFASSSTLGYYSSGIHRLLRFRELLSADQSCVC